MICHAFSFSYLHDFVVLIVILLENNFLAIGVFLVISLGVVWQCPARTELSSPNGEIRKWHAMDPSLSLNISTCRGSVNNSHLLEMKKSTTTCLVDEIILMTLTLSINIFCFITMLGLNEVITLPYHVFP